MIKVPVEPGTKVSVDGKECTFIAVTDKEFLAAFENEVGIPFQRNIFDAKITLIGSTEPLMQIPQSGK